VRDGEGKSRPEFLASALRLRPPGHVLIRSYEKCTRGLDACDIEPICDIGHLFDRDLSYDEPTRSERFRGLEPRPAFGTEEKQEAIEWNPVEERATRAGVVDPGVGQASARRPGRLEAAGRVGNGVFPDRHVG
jgi:hypothetical protein